MRSSSLKGCRSLSPESAYDPLLFERLFNIEDRHFWFRARNDTIAAIVHSITESLAAGYRVVEIGCGTGNVLRFLDDICPKGIVVGMDVFIEGLRYAHQRTSALLIQGDVQMPPFNLPFDLIGLFDVLEHLPNDRETLRAMNGMCADGGRLLLTVPAHMSLWSHIDETHHYRRYEPDELSEKLVNAGYCVEYMTEYMMTLYPLIWFGRRVTGLLRRTTSAQDDAATSELRITPVVNEILYWLLKQEGRLIRRRKQLLFGTSLLVIARKGGS